ncbi:MAG TPA: amino acid adenylation domain-containing protein, partial [Pyrinomonadaceae bacterium]
MGHTNLKFLDKKLQKEKAYWSQKLSGQLVVTGLPLDYARPEACASEKDEVHLTLDGETARKLFKLCGKSESLILTALVAAQKICLHKYTGNTDILIGTAIHERYGGASSLNKVLILRDQISAEMTSKQLLLAVKSTISEAYSHQKYPFDRILDLLDIQYSANRAPLLDVVAILDNPHNRECVGHLKNDITFAFQVSDSAVTTSILYNPQLFSRATILLFGEHYERILNGLLDAPDAKISELEMLSADQKHQLLFDFNDTSRAYPQQSFNELFAAQVARTPEAIAVECEDEQLTYRELNERANQLAHHLRDLGVGRESLVGILLERSVEMVVALLGVLKAGAAYVPLDASHPAARLSFILQDTSASVLLTQQHLIEQLSEHSATVLCLDAESQREQLKQQSTDNPAVTISAAELAYVIYTSGSTGQPKGVKIQHGSLVNYLSWAAETYLCGQPLSFALYSSLAFDLTVTSIFLPLISGAQLVVYPGEAREGVLEQILSEDKAQALKLTPSHLRLIAERDNRESNLRCLIVGGEALPTQLGQAVVESFGGNVQLYNEYGPTEATVGCSVQRYEEQDQSRVCVPIGRPAANTRLYVLDERMQPVPVGVEGELYIGGEGLAQGYLNREELTRERFIADPYQAGERVYRSGDRARWLADGRLEYLGRSDEQVKRRGVRVELGELRAALNSHAGVRDSLVLVRQDGRGREALVSYYVARREIESEELRRHMAERVLLETVPEVYVYLRKMPLTLNGKVNVEGLPEWE